MKCHFKGNIFNGNMFLYCTLHVYSVLQYLSQMCRAELEIAMNGAYSLVFFQMAKKIEHAKKYS